MASPARMSLSYGMDDLENSLETLKGKFCRPKVAFGGGEDETIRGGNTRSPCGVQSLRGLSGFDVSQESSFFGRSPQARNAGMFSGVRESCSVGAKGGGLSPHSDLLRSKVSPRTPTTDTTASHSSRGRPEVPKLRLDLLDTITSKRELPKSAFDALASQDAKPESLSKLQAMFAAGIEEGSVYSYGEVSNYGPPKFVMQDGPLDFRMRQEPTPCDQKDSTIQLLESQVRMLSQQLAQMQRQIENLQHNCNSMTKLPDVADAQSPAMIEQRIRGFVAQLFHNLNEAISQVKSDHEVYVGKREAADAELYRQVLACLEKEKHDRKQADENLEKSMRDLLGSELGDRELNHTPLANDVEALRAKCGQAQLHIKDMEAQLIKSFERVKDLERRFEQGNLDAPAGVKQLEQLAAAAMPNVTEASARAVKDQTSPLLASPHAQRPMGPMSPIGQTGPMSALYANRDQDADPPFSSFDAAMKANRGPPRPPSISVLNSGRLTPTQNRAAAASGHLVA